MENYLTNAAKILSERMIGKFKDQAFEAWLDIFTIEKEDFYLYKLHNNYPYSKSQLREIYQKQHR